MRKKILFVLFMLTLCVFKINAQKKYNCTANMLENSESQTVCFTRDSFPENYATKYVILLNDNEVYEINFSFIKGADSSYFKIFYIDKRSTMSGTKYIKFKRGSSYYIIKNYMPNDTIINYNDPSYTILFSVPDYDKPWVILNKFLSIDDGKTLYRLTPIDPKILENHKSKTTDYITSEYIDSVNKANYHIKVESLKSEMRKYKTEKIDSIIEKERLNRKMPATLTAKTSLQSEFTKNMDSLFINYFKTIYSSSTDDFDVDFTFNCDGDGNIKIDPITSINFKGGQQKNWLRDSFMLRIKPRIEEGMYKTMDGSVSNSTLKSEFSNWFERKFDSYTNPPLIKTDLTETQNQINNELDQYLTRTISIPTIYTYRFKYRSEVTQSTWKYTSDGSIKIIRGKEDVIDENLKNLFKDQICHFSPGRHDIEICKVYINNSTEPAGENIQPIIKQ